MLSMFRTKFLLIWISQPFLCHMNNPFCITLPLIVINSHSRTKLLFSVSSLMRRIREALSGDVLHLRMRVSNVP